MNAVKIRVIGSVTLFLLFATQTVQAQSNGLLGGLLGGGGSKKVVNGKIKEDDGRRVIEPAPRSAEADWTGIPFHKPVPAKTAGASQPVTDPTMGTSNGGPANRIAALPSSKPTSSRVPLPPAENSAGSSKPTNTKPSASTTGSSSSRTDLSSRASTAAAAPVVPRLETAPYEPPSATESSRRSGRKTVNPLEADRVASLAPPASPSPPLATSSRNSRTTSERTMLQVDEDDNSRDNASAQPVPAPLTPPSLDTAPSALSAAPSGAARPLPSNSVTERSSAVAGSSSNSGPEKFGLSSIGTSDRVAQLPPALPTLTEPAQTTPAQTTPAKAAPATTGLATATPADSLPAKGTNEIPGLRVLTSGPMQIAVNQTSTYKIAIENRGSIGAPGAMVQIALPAWVTVLNQSPTRGEVERDTESKTPQFLWLIEDLPAGASETITLQLQATAAQPFDVQVEFAVVPQSMKTTIAVLEPKLELLIEGPDQVVYGQSETYRVRVLNPGTGSAEGVVFTLSPTSATPQTQRIGSIPPGKEAQFEVELSALDMENLQIHGLATADQGLKLEKTKTIEVVAAQLQAVLSGPPLQYQDTTSDYTLIIENKGKVGSQDVLAALKIPAGMQYLGGIAGAELVNGQLSWEIPQIDAGQTMEYTFQCAMQQPGEHQLEFACEGSAAGATQVALLTRIEAIADLLLTINDPIAPAPVGKEVVYEVTIRNRGSKAATDIEASTKFGFDIEPVRVEGVSGRIEPGQVYFDKIPRIEPGAEITLRVFAKAEKPGLHGFRTEVRCGDILLVSEESTRYIEMTQQSVSVRSDQ